MSTPVSRRDTLAGLGLAAVATLARGVSAADRAAGPALKGRIRHSVCKWCYGEVSLEALAGFAQSIGMHSIELLSGNNKLVGEMEILRKHGLTCAIAGSPSRGGVGSIAKAWNRVEHHDTLVQAYEEFIPVAAKEGVPSVICFSGNREGMDDATGLKNCAAGIKRIMGAAEKHGVNIIMELLNSRVNHPDYMCDHTPWGVELVKAVGSGRFKLLYDIYHMQIMEGDVIATIRENHRFIGHYHTGGVPGRHEIDETQELFYPAIVRAIIATGYKGYLGQEFIPVVSGNLDSLKKAVVDTCDV